MTLDIDATVIESHKSTAYCTYKGVPGYTPMLGHIYGGYLVGGAFRKGNTATAAQNLSFIRHCQSQLPEGKGLPVCGPTVLRIRQRYSTGATKKGSPSLSAA
jgi:hypothetical protein